MTILKSKMHKKGFCIPARLPAINLKQSERGKSLFWYL